MSNKMREEMKRTLLLSGKPMNNVAQYSYLGEEISEEGVSKSVLATIKKRLGRTKQLIFEI